MPIRWRVDPVALLKEHGYNSLRIRQENIFGQQTLANLRYKKPVSFDVLGKICEITGKQPGKLIEYVPEGKAAKQPASGTPDLVQSDVE